MATFLDLAQKVAAESGTISGVQPSAVTGQTGSPRQRAAHH